MIKTYYYQTLQGEVIYIDNDDATNNEWPDLMENVRSMHQGLIKMFLCPFTENKAVRVMGVVK